VGSLVQRGNQILSLLDTPNGGIQIILECLDLQNEIERLKATIAEKSRQCEEPQHSTQIPIKEFAAGSITIEEFADKDGIICDKDLAELDWMCTIGHKTGLDVRAILTPLPKEVGLYNMQIVYKQHNVSLPYYDQIKQGTLKVWVVPAPIEQASINP
jgi:hypothetical protein